MLWDAPHRECWLQDASGADAGGAARSSSQRLQSRVTGPLKRARIGGKRVQTLYAPPCALAGAGACCCWLLNAASAASCLACNRVQVQGYTWRRLAGSFSKQSSCPQ